MVNVVTAITIDRPRGQVAAYAADPANAPEWYVNIDSARWLSAPPLEVGSRVAFSARFLGRTLSYVYETTRFQPSEQLTMRTAEGPSPMATTYTWADAGPGATRMELRNAGQPKGFFRVLGPLLARSMHKANTKDLRNLKRLLESR
ncbi:SRPBCC family protein [Arthrobacter tumbae]|uniref:SRPBCC family protein n=1 Tax=Arthrobacter tumbae TaxID=163874 RepID=UPI00195A3ACD|nr:SRPBCC family protein [Arthrobacter tumbae]MBM7782394.1 putative membrane protein [Arthrobacter tumbae]